MLLSPLRFSVVDCAAPVSSSEELVLPVPKVPAVAEVSPVSTVFPAPELFSAVPDAEFAFPEEASSPADVLLLEEDDVALSCDEEFGVFCTVTAAFSGVGAGAFSAHPAYSVMSPVTTLLPKSHKRVAATSENHPVKVYPSAVMSPG